MTAPAHVAPRHARAGTGLAAAGALFAAAAIALWAYVAHTLPPDARERMAPALTFLLLHGVALAALAPHARGARSLGPLLMLAAGTVLFCGSVLGGRLFGWPATMAPAGGALMIAAWLVQAVMLLLGGDAAGRSR